MTEELLQPGETIRPIIHVDECKTLVEALYGLECVTIEELNGYDDKNYKVTVSANHIKNSNIKKVANDGYVLKIMNSKDSQQLPFLEAQNEVMIFLGKNNVTCPNPIRNREGNFYSMEKFVSGKHVVRMLEFLSGSILYQVPTTYSLFYEIGEFVANLDEVLKGYHHPAYDSRQSIWALNNVPEVSQFFFAIKKTSKRKLCEEVVEQFKSRVLSVAHDLEQGIIHGDFNEQNVVVENGKIKGILDFGDSHVSCYLFELAIVLTYVIILDKNLETPGYVLAGYEKIRKVPHKEFSLLKICIAGRLVQSLVLGVYSSLQDPENTYILTTQTAGWDLLTQLWAAPEEMLLERWKCIENDYKPSL